MTSEEQEAESGKFGWYIMHLLRLKNGRLAAFNIRRQLVGIFDTADEALVAIEATRKSKPASPEPRRPVQALDLNLDDLEIKL